MKKSEAGSSKSSKLGARVRALRRQNRMTQVELASRLAISPAYLNLIEHNQRALTAPLLLKLAKIFETAFATFAEEDEGHIAEELAEVFGDALFDGHDLTTTDLVDLASNGAVSRAVLTLYHGYRGTLESLQALAAQASDGGDWAGVDPSRFPSEEVSDVLQENQNHFPEIELAAENLGREARLDRDDIYPALVSHLSDVCGIEVVVAPHDAADPVLRRFDPERRRLVVSEVLPPRTRCFQLAHQIGLIELAPVFETIIGRSRMTTADSVVLCRVALANYFAGALLMPYEPFLEATRELRYDVELLGHRFRTSFEQVCHRLTTLRRPGREGVPFHFIRLDIAGNISKRYSASGIRFARFSGLCPRWNVHAAFVTPGMVRTQLSRMPDGTTYLCLARTVRKSRGGYGTPHPLHAISLGCEVRYARELVYGDGLNLADPKAAVPIGITCRLCERTDCEQRAFPRIQRRLEIDENVRGVSFYAPTLPTRP